MPIPLDPTLLAILIEALAGALAPTGSPDQRQAAAHAALAALQPGNLLEAMLAIRMIAAHCAAIDSYRRAMLPTASDTEAARLRASAVATARSFDTAQRTLQQCQAPEPSPEPVAAPQPPAAKAPPPPPPPPARKPGYVPRNKFGEPIKEWRWEDMTMAQRRAANGDPNDLELQAIAIAEEEAMIAAEQQRAAGLSPAEPPPPQSLPA